MEEREVAYVDIPNAFIQKEVTDKNKRVIVRIRGMLVDILVKIAPDVYVINHMRSRFVCALSVTICAFLAIKNFARIDAYRLRFVSAVLQIVSPCSHTVIPKLADTKFHRSFVTMTPFLVS